MTKDTDKTLCGKAIGKAMVNVSASEKPVTYLWN